MPNLWVCLVSYFSDSFQSICYTSIYPSGPVQFPKIVNYFTISLTLPNIQFSSVAQSCLILRPRGLQHARLLCPSPTPWAYSNPCPVTLSSHLILCHPIPLPPSIFPSIGTFSKESVLHIRWPKYWSFSFNISPSREYSGLISPRMDWFDLAVQGTLKSLLQHHSSKASIFWCSAFFIVQLSHSYITTDK